MKSLNCILAVAASLAFFSSCSNDTDDSVIKDVKVEKTFGISSPESDTRAYIKGFDRDDSGQSIFWETNDQITIIAEGHSTGDTFKFDQYGSPKNIATFKGMTYEAEKYWAIYPAQPNAKLTPEGYLTVTIPSTQRAIDGTFDPEAAIQIGHAETSSGFGLKHVCAFFVVHLNPGYTYAYLRAKGTWKIAGTVTADPKSAGTPIKDFITDEENPIKIFGLDCSQVIQLTNIQAGGDFFISFIPSNSTPELELVINNGEGIMTYPFSSKVQFQAGKIYDLGSW